MVVSVIDQTGLVRAVSISASTTGQVRVLSDPSALNGVRLEWVGTDCDGQTTLVLGVSGGTAPRPTYEVALHVDPTVAGGFGCNSIDLPRAIVVSLTEPVEPERITIKPRFP